MPPRWRVNGFAHLSLVPLQVDLWQACCTPQTDAQVTRAMPFNKVPQRLQIWTLNDLEVQEKGIHKSVSECRQNFTLTQNVIWSFLLCSTSTQGTVNQPRYVERDPGKDRNNPEWNTWMPWCLCEIYFTIFHTADINFLGRNKTRELLKDKRRIQWAA